MKGTKQIHQEVWKRVISFSLPFLLSYFLQTLYGMADLFIIGQFDGVAATSAVAIGSQVMHMITVIIVGLAMGCIVSIGRYMGAKQYEKVKAVIANAVLLFTLLSLCMMVICLFAMEDIVAILATPAQAVADTKAYLLLCFLGIPFICAYNLISSIFRGMADSKRPLYFIAIACVCNIALDYLFVGGFHLGAQGAALATILAQAISVMISLFYVVKQKQKQMPRGKDIRFNSPIMRELCHIGIPIAIQDGFIQVAFLVITIFVNMRGLYDAAAVGIVEKMICILFLVPSSMLQTVSALGANHLGAKEYHRARLVLYDACIITIIWGLAIVLLMHWKASFFIQLFTSQKEVILLGSQYMKGYVWDCIFAGLHFSFSGYFCAYGYAYLSFLHNVISIMLVRLPCSYYATTYFIDTLYPMGLAVSFGSFVSVCICLLADAWLKRKGLLKL